MKLIKYIIVSPKQIFSRSKKDWSIVSRSDLPFFSSGSASSSTNLGATTLTSVLGVERSGEDELQDVFLFFNADCDGRITAEKLLQFFTMLGDEPCSLEECLRMIVAVDQNGDDFVCFENFSHMMCLKDVDDCPF